MNKLLGEFARIVEAPYVSITATKQKTGRRVIGCFPMYVPHELVTAAEMLPVDILGGTGVMTDAAKYLQSIVCYPLRSAFEQLATGQLSALDGVIFATICTGATSGGDMWSYVSSMPYYHQLVVPRKAGGEGTVQYFTYQIQRLHASLEQFGGRTISKECLADTIKLYNRSRALLEQVSHVSRFRPDALSPRVFAIVRAAASFLPREEYVQLLIQLLGALPDAKPPLVSSESVRLVLVGNLCDLPQIEFLAIIHEAGGTVVEDDTPQGRRMRVPVAEDGDPFAALAQRYVDMPPCPTKCDETVDANFDHLLRLARSSQAQGVIFLRPLYCDPAGLDFPLLIRRLNEANVPTLSLDVNGREGISGQLETRLQAFIEMLRR